MFLENIQPLRIEARGTSKEIGRFMSVASSRVARDRTSLSDECADHVRELIMSGQLRPGEFIRQERIAEEFDTSVTPVREGLLALRAEGFVQLVPRRGFAVSPLSRADVIDLFVAQALVAGELAARTAERASEEDVRRLIELQEDLNAAAQINDIESVEHINHMFHRQLNLAADSPKLAWTISVTSKFAPRRFFAQIPGWSDASAHDHDAIIEAIRRKDPEAARSAMDEHIRNAGQILAENLSLGE